MRLDDAKPPPQWAKPNPRTVETLDWNPSEGRLRIAQNIAEH
jgi:hypothetical protein